MNLKSAANLIENEYRARKAAAETAYRTALLRYPELLAAEKNVRAAILDGKTDEQISMLKEKRAEVMLSLGLDPNALYAKPRCSVCGDTGYSDGRFCDCVRRRAAKESVEYSAPPFTFDDCDFSIFEDESRETAELAFEKMRILCSKFPNTKNINVLLLGTVGTGKTFLASCMANELERRGFGCLFLSAFKFNDVCLKYHTSFDASRSDGLYAVINADMLIIDDLGTESVLKNVTLEYLYTVISERMNSGRHTVITTNLSREALEARYGERIASRLFSDRVCLTVAMNGKDLRR